MSPQSKIVSTKEVLAMLGVSHASFYRSITKKLGFPRPFQIGLRKNSYFRDQVEAWIDARAAAANGVPA